MKRPRRSGRQERWNEEIQRFVDECRTGDGARIKEMSGRIIRTSVKPHRDEYDGIDSRLGITGGVMRLYR